MWNRKLYQGTSAKGHRPLKTVVLSLALGMSIAVYNLTSVEHVRALSPFSVEPAHFVAAGASHTCALTQIPIGGVTCWGSNVSGQLGDGTKTDRTTPTQVQGLTSGVSSVVAGESHTCALIAADGSVKCWGANTIGQLGDRSGVDKTTPINVLDGYGAPLTGAVALTAGMAHTCVTKGDGSALCWGRNLYGQLGIGNTSNTNVPSSVASSNITRISAGGEHTCLVQSTTKEIQCSGYNVFGQLGNSGTGPSAYPGTVYGISTGEEVAAGAYHSCGILSNSKLYCWGKNSNGQLGDGGSNVDSTVPVAVANLGNTVTKVSAGGRTLGHTCAIHGVANDLSCWGAGAEGQLGDTLASDSNVPTAVEGIADVIDVSAGGDHTCAVDSSCAIKCWGSNMSGQIGDGSGFTNRISPVTVTTCVKNAPATPTPTPTPTATPTPTPEACLSESNCVADPSLTSALNPRSPTADVTVGSTVQVSWPAVRAGIPTDPSLREALRKKLEKFFKIKVPDIGKVLRTMRVFYNVDIRPAPRGVAEYATSSRSTRPTRARLETRKTRVSTRLAPGTYVAKITLRIRDSKGRLFSSSQPGTGTRFTVQRR